jgi:peptidoglycan hydrolase-like protein with peptidoglycan-binding domain
VQHLLTARGHATAADGIFGSDTEAKVKSFQTATGLAVTGVVDATTWPALVIAARNGSTGDPVRGVQRQLNKYAYGLVVDGIFGPATEAAARDFQRQNGLLADGIVGRDTWRTLTGGAV